ncbi:S41 family peptidase [Tenacibaculum ovolyticum]|uniref:S41 family peptidase n=1 Tax=Tenacibaculum ovolyticum TaxID=104270 RepID=UPI0022F4067B|nr:S41 family peptidase [Tenacibaculum ovolyticum]WBX77985.1 S41 family peptidase [Tenacibaculum ovolyticum]
MSNIKTNQSLGYKTILCILSLVIFFYSCDSKKNRLSINAAPQEFHILKTDTVAYSVKLIKDKFYSFNIDQKGIDLVVYLVNSKNEIVKEKDSPNGRNGAEQFYFYCENQDEYQLQIKPLNENENSKEGKYSVAISEVSTETEISLSEPQYLEDFKIFRGIFEKANSGLYRYHSKKEVDSVFSINKSKIGGKTTYLEFQNLIWNVIDYTGSCHNNLRFPKYLKTLLFRKDIFFPVPLKFLDKKLYSNCNYKGIPSGAEIISVNKIAATQFANKISRFRSTDGFNETSKFNFIQTNLAPFYIYKAYGEQDEFVIEYKYDTNVKSVTVKGVNYATYKDNYNKRYSKKYEEKIQDDYHYEYIDSLDVGLLSVKSFAVGQKGNESYSKYKSFLDTVFISLKNKKNLIVDLRRNGGGSGDALMLLTTYLSNRIVKENVSAYTIFNKIPYPEFYKGSIKQSEDFLLDYVTEFNNGKYYQNQKFNPEWKPNKNRFQKNFILLIDPFVASAASHFSAHIKSDKRAIVIGEETGGTYYGHTGHLPATYELPNSKLGLNFSVVNLEQDVVKLKDEEFGNGVMPDIKIIQSHKDFLENKDSQLNYALKYIKNKATK